MTKKRHPRGDEAGRGSSGVEWVGGTFTIHAYVSGEGEPYRPEVLLWLGAEGAALGTVMGRPGEVLPQAGASLQETMERPMWGPAHAPARIRVASPELAEALRAEFPRLEILLAPTPELDEVVESMHGHLASRPSEDTSYLLPANEPDACASFCRAAAALYRAKPWKVVPSDQDLFSISIPALEIQDAALSVIGQMGENRGFVLFAGLDGFQTYLEAARRFGDGGEFELPAHLALNFDRRAVIPPELYREVKDHGWEVATRNAYPWVLLMDESAAMRSPVPRELVMVEAVCLALSEMLGDRKALRAAWRGGERVSRTLSVPTYQGPMEVTLFTPYDWASASNRPPSDVLGALYDLAKDSDGFLEPEDRGPLEDELVHAFANSREATGVEDFWPCHCVMDLAADYFDQTIATLGPSDLDELLFHLIPRKVSIDASAAGSVIDALRSFYAFLKRELQLEQADACLRVLGGDAAARFEAAMADSENFGMAKSLVMAGREAGYDIDSKEGLEAWLESIRGMPLPPEVGRPISEDPRPSAHEAARRAKKKRKAARKSRRKNR